MNSSAEEDGWRTLAGFWFSYSLPKMGPHALRFQRVRRHGQFVLRNSGPQLSRRGIPVTHPANTLDVAGRKHKKDAPPARSFLSVFSQWIGAFLLHRMGWIAASRGNSCNW